MRVGHVKYLVCPECSGELGIIEILKQDIISIETGVLRCFKCETEYKIINYIPRFVAIENYASGFGFEWIKHAKTQYDSYTGEKISEKRFFDEAKWEKKLDGQIILEVGCGSGRFTEQAASTGAMVITMDYSFAVEANYASNGSKGNVLIVQADLYKMPFRKKYFDKLFCLGVLQHTPYPEKAFFALPEYLKSGGQIVIDIYNKASGIKHLLKTKYWIRLFTKHMPAEKLYKWCENYIKFMWPFARILHNFPKVGKYLNLMLLIPDYIGIYNISDEMLMEWAVLDLFDMLSPMYDYPQTIETVRKWFADAEVNNVDVHYGYNGIEGRAIKN